MENEYKIKLEDFIPFIGPFLYIGRCSKEAIKYDYEENVKIDDEYIMKGIGLTFLDFATGLAGIYGIICGLEKLLH